MHDLIWKICKTDVIIEDHTNKWPELRMSKEQIIQ